jgi:glycosyltransferase involved in cell wall biosynthesis
MTGISQWRFIIVNDGSIDATAQHAEAFAGDHPGILVLHHSVNRGLGAALQTGFAHANADIVVTLDADLSYSPDHLDKLIESVNKGADLVLTSAYAPGGMVAGVPIGRQLLSRGANIWLRFATGGQFYTYTGMVRAYRGPSLAMLQLDCDGVEINLEILEAAFAAHWKIVEIPAQLVWRDSTSDRGVRLVWRRIPGQILDVFRWGKRLRSALKN